MNKDDKFKSELHTGHQWQEETMMDSTSQSVVSSGEPTHLIFVTKNDKYHQVNQHT